MKLIQYIGTRTSKTDNVAGTGLTWTPEQVHPVSDDRAAKLLGYPSVWQEAKAESKPESKPEPVAAAEVAPPAAWPRQRARPLKQVS